MPNNVDERRVLLTDELVQTFVAGNSLGPYFAIWSSAGTLRRSEGPAPHPLPTPVRDGGDTSIHFRTRGSLREAWHFTERGECVLVGRSIALDLAALHRFGWLLTAGGAAVLAIALGGGSWIVARALKPVDDISVTAMRIAAGDLADRINVAETDSELGRLARVLNETFARLDAAFARQQQFTADAAHELRTPLAVIISEAQLALNRERSPEAYRHAIETCLETAQQMRHLIESLLALARFDAGQEQLHLTRLDPAECTRESVHLVTALASARGMAIHCELSPVETQADAERLGQVITNLLTNAVNYSRENGEIHVATRADNGSAVLTVADTGEGIALDDLPHIFDRFYRADKSRARSEGHCGLGLAICKAAVEAQGGTITASSWPGTGTTFTVRLPMSEVSRAGTPAQVVHAIEPL